MHRPMMTQYGVNFERKAVVNWLQSGNLVCPVTKQNLSPRDLIRKHKLQNQIDEWPSENNHSDVPMNNEESEHDDVARKTMMICFMALTSPPQAKKVKIRTLFSTAA